MKKTVFFALLVIVLAFGLIGCGDDNSDNGNNDTESIWWTWHSSQEEGNYVPTARVSISPNTDDSGFNATVTGTVNSPGYAWGTQIGCDYTATGGKTYKVSWKWVATGKSFSKVVVRFVQYHNDPNYEVSSLTIPTTEETKTYEFTMPDTPEHLDFAFYVGEDLGSFKIRDFKIEEVTP